MNHIMKGFVLSRMEAVDERIRNDDRYCQQKKILHEAGKRFRDACGIESEVWQRYCEYEEKLSTANCLYSETAYCLGFEEGLQMAAEQQVKAKKSTLNFKDMEHMVYLYDAAKKINAVFGGNGESCHAEGGVLKEFDRIFHVIKSCVCSDNVMLGEDEAADRIVSVLNNDSMMAEEKAKILTGLQKPDEEV